MPEAHIILLFYYFKLLGLATMSLSCENSRSGHWVLQKSYFGRFYNILIIGLLIFLVYYGLENREILANNMETITITVYDTTYTLIILSVTLILLYFLVRQDYEIDIAKEIQELEQMLDMDRSNSITGDNSLRIRVAVMFLIYFVTCITRCVIYSIYYPSILFYVNFPLLNLLILDSVALKYSVSIKFIHHLFKHTNQQLLTVLLQFNNRNGYDMLAKIFEIHSNLCQMSRELSRFYSFPIFFYVLCMFELITVIFYNAFISIIWNPISKPFELRALKFLCSICTIFCLLLLTKCVNDTINECKRTREIVKDYLRITADPKMMIEMDKYRRCMYQEIVNFNVFNIFPLDKTLLISMAGPITSYLIILLQFYGAQLKNGS